MVISGRSKVGSMETETLKSGHGGENNEVTDCPIQMTVNLNLEARLTEVPLEGWTKSYWTEVKTKNKNKKQKTKPGISGNCES